jgi:uridine monophosphate synthetase
MQRLTYKARAKIATHPLAQKIFSLMESKKTNISLSLDVTSSDALLSFADLIGPEICVLKTHIDILNDFMPSITKSLKEFANYPEQGLLLLAEMSSKDNLLTKDYAEKTWKIAQSYKDFVIGFIAQANIIHEPEWLYFTPGIQFTKQNDNLKQQYITPEKAIQQGSDILIIGRGILEAKDPLIAAKEYREAGWKAYEKGIFPL